MNELDAARGIIGGTLQSPLKLDDDLWLVSLRITGTGTAYRAGLDEHVWRDPDQYLTQEFCDRCSGLPVLIEHPEGLRLDAEEYAARAIGAVMLGYLRPPAGEVWAVARLNIDDDMIEAITEASTSPSVIMRKGESVDLDDGSTLLIEGEPLILDHVAIVPEGVWDKAGAAGRGIDDGKDLSMADDKEGEGKEGGELARSIVEALNAWGEKFLDALRADDGKRRRRKDDKRADDDEGEDDPARRSEPEPMSADDGRSRRRIDDDEKEENERLEAQYRADAAYNAWGLRAGPPMIGERARAYRLRMMRPLQKHSKQFAPVTLASITDKALFDEAERVIYADAVAASCNNEAVGPGKLRETVRLDPAGRQIHEFFGDVEATLAPFKLPTYRVKRFNKDPDRHW